MTSTALPPGWHRRRLGALMRIATGQVDPRVKPYSNMLHVGPDNIPTGGGHIIGELQTAEQQELISGKYLFDAECVLYSKIRPNLNKVAAPEFSGLCSADIYPIWPKDTSVDRIFLFQLLRSELVLRPAVAVSARTGLPKINRPDLEALEVLLPPLSEQRRIADILATWDRALERLNRQVARKRELFAFLRESLIRGVKQVAGSPWSQQQGCLGDVSSSDKASSSETN